MGCSSPAVVQYRTGTTLRLQGSGTTVWNTLIQRTAVNQPRWATPGRCRRFGADRSSGSARAVRDTPQRLFREDLAASGLFESFQLKSQPLIFGGDSCITYLHQTRLLCSAKYIAHRSSFARYFCNKEIDWLKVRSQASALAGGAQTTEEMYPAIAFACTQLKSETLSCLILPSNTSTSIVRQVDAVREAAEEAAHGRPLTRIEPSPFSAGRALTLNVFRTSDGDYAYLVIPFDTLFHTEYEDPRLRHKWAEQLFDVVSKCRFHLMGRVMPFGCQRLRIDGYLARESRRFPCPRDVLSLHEYREFLDAFECVRSMLHLSLCPFLL
jgi:hypothetical protein